jgi:biofilm PGA synthesis N-glycosyltransferase PgaC
VELRDLVISWQNTWWYEVLLIFFALYPVVSSLVWITTSFLYYWRWERRPDPRFYDIDTFPLVSVIVPAYAEEKTIARTLEGILRIDYPFKEIVVVDDGSPDGTVSEVMPFVKRGQVRLVRKRTNEGKAMALNDTIPLVSGEILLIMDADAYPDPGILRWIVPHFRFARVAAVTGNPRVANRHTLLSKLQLIEFASIVGLLRRAQRVWGRILTMSGVVGAFRRSAVIDAGLYSPEMATEDIDMTWKLQRRYYDVRYEPRALVWMQVPAEIRPFFRQRLRWARGARPGAAPQPGDRPAVDGPQALGGHGRGGALHLLGVRRGRPHRVLDPLLRPGVSPGRRLSHPELVGDAHRHDLPSPAPRGRPPGAPL